MVRIIETILTVFRVQITFPLIFARELSVRNLRNFKDAEALCRQFGGCFISVYSAHRLKARYGPALENVRSPRHSLTASLFQAVQWSAVKVHCLCRSATVEPSERRRYKKEPKKQKRIAK